MIEERCKQSARELLEFIGLSPTAAHAASQVETRLVQAGFRKCSEQDTWLLQTGDRILVKRQESGIVAIKMGKKTAVEGGFKIIGAHTDSPGFRLKPHALSSESKSTAVRCWPPGSTATWVWPVRWSSKTGRTTSKRCLYAWKNHC